MAKRFIGGEIVSNVAPAGSVAAFAGSSAPDGWIFCQGQELSKTEYPELYAAIGDGWNTATNPTSGSAYAAPAAGSFRLPDFRGAFLRGAGSPHAGDTCSLAGHQGQATSKNGLTASGSFAKSGLNHGHVFRQYGSGGGNTGTTVSSSNTGFSSSGGLNTRGSEGTYVTTKSFSGDQSVSVSVGIGDSETRPLNQGVNYIIKY